MINQLFQRSARSVVQRHMQTSAPVSTTFLTKGKEYSVKKAWLSDPATYPLLVVMGGAAFLVVGVMASCLLASPDVQVSPQKRNQILRTWGLPGYKHSN